jgi:hypothetical protein
MFARRKYTEMDSPKNLKQDTEGKWGLNCIKLMEKSEKTCLKWSVALVSKDCL